MKKVVFVIVLFAFIAKANCQTEEAPVMTKADYLKKAKGEKIAAWITLGVGVGLVVAGSGSSSISWGNQGSDGGFIFAIIGAGAALASIPIFVSAQKDKKMAASVAISNLQINYPSQNNFVVKRQPAITLKIPLR